MESWNLVGHHSVKRLLYERQIFQSKVERKKEHMNLTGWIFKNISYEVPVKPTSAKQDGNVSMCVMTESCHYERVGSVSVTGTCQRSSGLGSNTNMQDMIWDCFRHASSLRLLVLCHVCHGSKFAQLLFLKKLNK